MTIYNRFGEFFKEKRCELGLTLREFSKRNGFDPGNLSKIERGILRAPQDEDLRLKYARALQLEEGSDDWIRFFDYAAADLGRLPEDLLDDETIVSELPLFFRTIRDSHPTKEDLRRLIEAIKRES